MRRFQQAAAVAAAAALVVVAATPDPERAVRGLGASTSAEREAAAAEIARIGRPAVPALERATQDEDPDVRDRARRVLAAIRRTDRAAEDRRSEAEAVLRSARAGGAKLRADGEDDHRLADLLPESGDALAAAALRGIRAGLADEDLVVALARHATPATLDALVLLWEADVVAPSAAARTALALAPAAEPVPAGGGPPMEVRLAAADRRRAVESGARAAAVRIAAAPARSAPRRLGRTVLVAALLARAGDDSVRSHLAWALRDPDASVRREAVRAAGRLRVGWIADDLVALTEDMDAGVRAEALESLASLPGRPRPEAALRAAEDEVPAVRRAAVRLLATDGGPEARPVLLTLAEDPSLSVRTDARRALRPAERE